MKVRKPIESDKALRQQFKKNDRLVLEIRELFGKYRLIWQQIQVESEDVLIDILARYALPDFSTATFVCNMLRDSGLIEKNAIVFDILKRSKNQFLCQIYK